MTRDAEPELDAFLRAVATELKRPVPLRAGLAAQVLREAGRSLPTRAIEWTTRPRQIPVSPLSGLIAAAAVIGAFVLTRARPTGSADPVQRIEFVLFAPTASEVTLVGDFNDWDASATPLTPSRQREGTWTVEIPLAAGPHEYAFLVNGSRWTVDPAAPRGPATEFGTPNSVLTVTGT